MTNEKQPETEGKAAVDLTRVVSWLRSLWKRRADGLLMQAKGDIVWWLLRRRVLAKYRRTRDPHIIRKWEWNLALMEDHRRGGRLAIEIQNMIDELKAS